MVGLASAQSSPVRVRREFRRGEPQRLTGFDGPAVNPAAVRRDAERRKTLILLGKRDDDGRRLPVRIGDPVRCREMSTHDLPGFVGDLLESRGCARSGSNPDRGCGQCLQLPSVAVGQRIERALPRRVGGVVAVLALRKHGLSLLNATIIAGARPKARLINGHVSSRFNLASSET